MRLTITMTVQVEDGPETPVFKSDTVTPETLSSTLAVARESVRGTIVMMQPRNVRMRQYLGPSLLKEELLAA